MPEPTCDEQGGQAGMSDGVAPAPAVQGTEHYDTAVVTGASSEGNGQIFNLTGGKAVAGVYRSKSGRGDK